VRFVAAQARVEVQEIGDSVDAEVVIDPVTAQQPEEVRGAAAELQDRRVRKVLDGERGDGSRKSGVAPVLPALCRLVEHGVIRGEALEALGVLTAVGKVGDTGDHVPR